MGSLHNIQLMLEFLKGSFFVLHFSYYILMTLLMMTLLSTLRLTRYLICGNNSDWLLNFSLIYEIVLWGRKWLVDFEAEKTQLILLDLPNNTGVLNVKMNGSVLKEKSSLTMTFSSVSSIVSIAKTASKKMGALIHSMKFLSVEVVLYLYKSIIQLFIEYCCHIWAGALSCYLELLDKLQKPIYKTVGTSPTASLEPLAHHQSVASLFLFCMYYFGMCSSELAQLVPLFDS